MWWIIPRVYTQLGSAYQGAWLYPCSKEFVVQLATNLSHAYSTFPLNIHDWAPRDKWIPYCSHIRTGQVHVVATIVNYFFTVTQLKGSRNLAQLLLTFCINKIFKRLHDIYGFCTGIHVRYDFMFPHTCTQKWITCIFSLKCCRHIHTRK